MYLLKLMMLLKKFCHDCYQKLFKRRNTVSVIMIFVRSSYKVMDTSTYVLCIDLLSVQGSTVTKVMKIF